MNSQMISSLAAQHHEELLAAARQRQAAAGSRGPRRRVPRFHVNWSRTTFAPACTGGRPERSWVIIISASKTA
jgi:hypothetical protein